MKLTLGSRAQFDSGPLAATRTALPSCWHAPTLGPQEARVHAAPSLCCDPALFPPPTSGSQGPVGHLLACHQLVWGLD